MLKDEIIVRLPSSVRMREIAARPLEYERLYNDPWQLSTMRQVADDLDRIFALLP